MSRHSANGHRYRRLRLEVLDRDWRICWLCGHPGADTIDHVIPKSHGGPDETWNMRAAHHSCNSQRGDRTPIPPDPTYRTTW